MTEICVIIGVYNMEKYLRRCLDSIRAQTFAAFEVILIDNGSTDASGGICEAYSKKDERFHVIHQANGGAAASRNRGLDWAFERAAFRYIAFIDADDYVHPLYLQALYETAEERDAGVVITDYMISYGEALPVIEGWTVKEHETEEYYLHHTVGSIVPWGKLIRIDRFRDLRFPEGKMHEDEFVLYKVVFMDRTIVALEQPLYAYFQNDEGQMRSKWTVKRMDILEALEEQVDFFWRGQYHKAAKSMFYALVHSHLQCQKRVLDCGELSGREQKETIRWLKKDLRRVLLKYRRHHWMPFLQNRRSVAVHLNAFVPGYVYLLPEEPSGA